MGFNEKYTISGGGGGGGLYLFSNVNICGPVIAYFENITNLEILPYLLHFSEVLKNVNYQIFCRVTYVTG